jgi:hypothetical protein
MMSDYEVQLTDETKTNDFHIKFHGPKESALLHVSCLQRVWPRLQWLILIRWLCRDNHSAVRRRRLEDSCFVAEGVSVQEPINWLCEPHLPSERR